jgi:DMSO/TMAO reductase YedYZ molybdopterin-dependent catalytic subunit
MRFPWANLALLGLLLVQLATGVAGLVGAGPIVFWLHVIGAYALVAVVFAKALLVVHAWRRRGRRRTTRAVLVVLASLLVAVLVSGFAWSAFGPHYLLGYSVINLHAFLALGLLTLLAWHVVDRRWIVRVPAARDRRAFLYVAASGLLGIVLWRLERPAQHTFGLPGARRRWTGSYETASGTPFFPETSWIDDAPQPIDASTWRLVVDGAVRRPLELRLDELRHHRRDSREAIIDCTGGWYSRQHWEGIVVADLLAEARLEAGAESVSFVSVTGYTRRFSLEHARGLLLATDVAGTQLDHGHGFPLRLVVPGRRGVDWVKWIVRIRVERTSALLQPPLPLT